MSDYGVLDEALAAFTTYKVGEAADGTVFHSYDSLTPIDDTVVFPAGAPDDDMTVLEAEDRYGTVYWMMEPEVVGQPMTAAMGGAPDLPPNSVSDTEAPAIDGTQDPVVATDVPAEASLAEQPVPNEADRAEQEAALEDAEARVAQLEGMVTELLLRTVTDEVFVGEHGLDSIVEQNRPKVAALLSTVVAGFGDVTPLAVRLAAMASQDTTDDVTERLDKLIERLQKLEETITKMMDEEMDDEEMPSEAENESSESPSTADETGKRTAGKKNDD